MVHLKTEVRISEFPTKSLTGTPPQVGLPTWKVGATSQTPNSQSKMVAVHVNSGKTNLQSVLLLLCICDWLNEPYTDHWLCPTRNRYFDVLWWCRNTSALFRSKQIPNPKLQLERRTSSSNIKPQRQTESSISHLFWATLNNKTVCFVNLCHTVFQNWEWSVVWDGSLAVSHKCLANKNMAQTHPASSQPPFILIRWLKWKCSFWGFRNGTSETSGWCHSTQLHLFYCVSTVCDFKTESFLTHAGKPTNVY